MIEGYIRAKQMAFRQGVVVTEATDPARGCNAGQLCRLLLQHNLSFLFL